MNSDQTDQAPTAVNAVEDAPLTIADTGGSWGILPEIGLKLLNNFLSRKFLVLVVAVWLFLRKSEAFTASHLIVVFALYCVASVSDKIIDKIPWGKP